MALFGCFLIIIIILADLALIVVKAWPKVRGVSSPFTNRTDCAVYRVSTCAYPWACG
ncbi:hypothetical protein ACNKHV_27410 [Shigella flexneri]